MSPPNKNSTEKSRDGLVFSYAPPFHCGVKEFFHDYYFMKLNFRIQGIFGFRPLPGNIFCV